MSTVGTIGTINLIHGNLYFYELDGDIFIGFYLEEHLHGLVEKSLVEVWWQSDLIFDPSTVSYDLAIDNINILKDLGDKGFDEDYIPQLKKDFPEYFL